MVKPDWNIFKTKFTDNPQKNFEWFCYLLFCEEFNKPQGIFRYYNQVNIETDPIKVGDDVIAFQAKFYDATLSSHKKDILTTLTNVKKNYSDVTKLLFYTNNEWVQSKGKTPRGKTEIETKANELNIILEWKTASFFESKSVSITYKDISSYFFSLVTDIENLLLKLKDHTSTILAQIQTEIQFKDTSIKLNRDSEIEKIANKENLLIIVHGEAGTGKTAVIKMLFEKYEKKIPFYLFRAIEFNKPHINDLFSNCSLENFINIHLEEPDKIVVIDSAEKIMDFDYSEPIKDFIFKLKENNWKIIFTTRNLFLNELIFKFLGEYTIVPQKIHIENISENELSDIFKTKGVLLPNEHRLKKLLETPFYLNEYLKLISNTETFNYVNFKNTLWAKKIDIQTASAFIHMAISRANKGSFYISDNTIDTNICNSLLKEGILGKEEKGYFIAHDIYEEWALEKFIDKVFFESTDESSFIKAIGSSLPVRRSYGSWLSEKLVNKDEEVLQFIKKVILSGNIENYWKDGTIIAILLSDYAKVFFQEFSSLLLENNFFLLRRIAFLLQLACKETDNESLSLVDITDRSSFSAGVLFIRPKGKGWNAFIEFIFLNKEIIDFNTIEFVLSRLSDWNSKFFEGKTTRAAALLALEFYEWCQKSAGRHFYKENERIFTIICNGSKEIKTELKMIFDEIIKNKWNAHTDYFSNFVEEILKKPVQYFEIYKNIPDSIMQLADLFWSIRPRQDIYDIPNPLDFHQYFGLEENSDYFPPSAFQTPVWWLLNANLIKTMDFIIDFTNKCVQCYKKSDFDKTAQEISFLSRKNDIKQISSKCLWNIYRGTSSPVSPYLLQSIHMALEKYLFEKGKILGSTDLESLLFYIIEKSQSVSLTAIVAIIVLAYPEKTFNVAYTLFSVKECIQLDSLRKRRENEAKMNYAIGGYGEIAEIYRKERLGTCEEKHRQNYLENLFLNYQSINIGNVTNDELDKRQKLLHELLDNYYKELPPVSKQTDDDKDWRLALTRIDYRNMKVTEKKVDDGILLTFTPEFKPELKKYQEKLSKSPSPVLDHMLISLWARYKWEKDPRAEDYSKYNESPTVVLAEIKKICEKLKENSLQDSFYSLNPLISISCSCLVRDYFDTLQNDEKEFCKDIILEFAFRPLQPNYSFQVENGTKQAITVLGKILLAFPNEYVRIKRAILLNLVWEESRVMSGKLSRDDAIETLKYLIEDKSSQEFYSFFCGYRFLKPKHKEFCKKSLTFNQNNKPENKNFLELFYNENQSLFESFTEKKLVLFHEDTFNDLSLDDITVMVHLSTIKLPYDKRIVVSLISQAVNILNTDKDIDTDPFSFGQKYALFLLQSSEENLIEFINPFLLNFSGQIFYSYFFKEIISAQDSLHNHENFWIIWNHFKPKIIEFAKNNKSSLYVDKIIIAYLFAANRWKNEVHNWKTFQPCDEVFFKEIVDEIGINPFVLFSLSKLLYGIGNCYLKAGIDWIADMINQYDAETEILPDTIWYLENIIRRYIMQNQDMIKKKDVIKKKIIIILNFLVEKGSATGYRLRENLL